MARLLGVKRLRFDRQIALVGWLVTDRGDDVDATLTVESTPSGWWYTCRLPEGRRVAGWVIRSRPDARTWEARLRATRHLAPLVAGYRVERPLVVRVADSSLLERCFGPGWIAIGDALSSGIEAATLIGAPAARLAAWQASLEARFTTYRAERARLYG